MADARFQWLDGKTHVLTRADTYVGRIAVEEVEDYAFRCDDAGKWAAYSAKATFSPAVFKFVDEALVNAMDAGHRDPSQRTIKIDIRDDGVMSVVNDGETIPIQHYKDTQRFLPEILFSELMSGENFDDSVERQTGGRNGYGIKLVNLFSKWFEVTLVNFAQGLSYKQRFEDNLSVVHAPIIKNLTAAQRASKKSWTTVEWMTDYARLNMPSGLPSEAIPIIAARAFDAAACTRSTVGVHLNGTKLTLKSISDFAACFGKVYAHEEIKTADGRVVGDMCVVDGASVGFVNGIRCSTGTLMDACFRSVADTVKTLLDRKKVAMPARVNLRDLCGVVVRAQVPNPSWTSQAKEQLNTPCSKFGFSVPALSPKSARGIDSSGVVQHLVSLTRVRDDKAVSKTSKGDRGKVLAINKYERALKRGGRLWVTEGDSAKALAVEGFSIIGREQNGVFALRGKLPNVRGQTAKRALENREILHLTQILGLDPCATYDAQTIKGLPYKELVIFTDQDNDGSHIMGLVLNWLDVFYPTLLRANPHFVKRFVTPIVRASVGRGASPRMFFTLNAYNEWRATHAPSHVKYYKGLGTSTNEEARVYFGDLPRHLIGLRYTGDDCAAALHKWFAKETAEQRKDALRKYDATAYVDYDAPTALDLTYDLFTARELICFSTADNVRSIPSAIDGLKPGQRKAVDVTQHVRDEIRVSQLASRVSEKLAYHHGEAAMVQTIINMAQHHVGTNNVPYFRDIGQFGSRANPRTDHASARYITTLPEPILKCLFHKSDAPVLERAFDDNKPVEPVVFVPVVASLLLNGAEGVGTGWNSKFPPFNPRDVIAATREMIAGRAPPKSLVPFYRGFVGTVVADPPGQSQHFALKGAYRIDGDTVVVTELPPRQWIDDYMEWVKKHCIEADDAFATDVVRTSSGDDVEIRIKCKSVPSADASVDWWTRLNLVSKINTCNMNAFDVDGVLTHYEDIEEIFRAHEAVRRRTYTARLAHMIAEKTTESIMARERVRWIEMNVSNAVDVTKLRSAGVIDLLRAHRFYEHEGEFKYLTQMELLSLTQDKAEELRRVAAALDAELDALRATTVEAMWTRDLDDFERAYDELEADFDEKKRKKSAAAAKAQNGGKPKAKKRVRE